MTIPKILRDQFEDYAYSHYEASRMSQALRGVKVAAKIEREAYFERDSEDNYRNPAVSILWQGWKLCLEANAHILEAANLWLQWAEQQDRVETELPAGYTIMLCMERAEDDGKASWVDLVNDDGEVVPYPDPADLESPGSLFRIIDAALSAAKADNARRMN